MAGKLTERAEGVRPARARVEGAWVGEAGEGLRKDGGDGGVISGFVGGAFEGGEEGSGIGVGIARHRRRKVG